MSVQPGPTFKRYAANGVATVYAIPFLLLDAADLKITLDGTLVTTGFTLAGVGSPTSSCTFSVAPAGDLLFQMVMTFQRLADYQMNGDFLSSTVNRDYDRLWLAVKQVSRDSGRALTVSQLDPEGIPPLPAKDVRALKILAFDASGNPVTSSLTLAQIEQQPALAIDAVQQAIAAKDAALVSAGAAHTSELAAAASAADAHASELAAATYAADPWALQPLGVPIGMFFDTAGAIPPTNNPAYRYVKLTAGDAYNDGVLTSESVTGVAPLVLASAVISLAGSPFNGFTVQLINTERRALRAGAARTIEQDQIQNITGSMIGADTATGAPSNATGAFASVTNLGARPSPTSATGYNWDFNASRVARTGVETRVKNVGVTYFMRIK